MPSQSANEIRPVLIIDKLGNLGIPLAFHLSQAYPVVAVTNAKFNNKKIFKVRYGTSIPKIPNNKFSYIFLIDCDDAHFSHFLNACLGKAKKDNGHVFVIKNIYHASAAFIDKSTYLNEVTVFYYADIYAEKFSFSNRLHRIIKEVQEEGTMRLLDSGLHLVYPARLAHAVSIIVSSMESSVNGIFCLFPKSGVTEIALGRIIHSKLPDTHIILEEKKSERNIHIPEQSTETITTAQALASLEEADVLRIAVGLVDEQEKATAHRRRQLAYSTILLQICIFTFLLLFCFPLLFFGIGTASFFSLVHQLEQGKFAVAAKSANIASESFALVNETARPLTILGGQIGLGSIADTTYTTVESYRHTSLLLQQLSEGLSQMQDAKSSQNEDIGIAKTRIAMTQVEELSAEHAYSFLPQHDQYLLTSAIQGASSIQDSLPFLLGTTVPKTYLILFQNSNELRPGGGFIGSYGLLTIAHARIQSFSVHDIYSLDGRMQGHITPPAALRQYLGVQNWFLRDSNFFVDQNQNGATENYFYTIESGKTIDGIIIVDTYVVQNLLQLTGSLFLPSYNQNVNAGNFFQVSEDHAEKNFTPGSVQKQAFLSALFTTLQQHIATHPLSLQTMLQLLTSQIMQKHMSMWVRNQLINKEVQNALVDFQSPEIPENTPSINDLFGINEANLGLNKVNRYIKRSFQHVVTIDTNGIVTHTATVTYTNTSNSHSSYGGDYKVFVRAVIPQDSILTHIRINNKEQPLALGLADQPPVYKGQTFLPAGVLPVYSEEVSGANSYGIFVDVPQGGTTTIRYSYTLGKTIVKGDGQTTYTLYLLKQPGTDKDLFSFHLRTAQQYSLHPLLCNGVVSSHDAALQYDLSVDRACSIVVEQ